MFYLLCPHCHTGYIGLCNLRSIDRFACVKIQSRFPEEKRFVIYIEVKYSLESHLDKVGLSETDTVLDMKSPIAQFKGSQRLYNLLPRSFPKAQEWSIATTNIHRD